MLKDFTPEQQIEIALRRRNEEQEELAREGVSSAVMGNQVVTIDNLDWSTRCDLDNFKHFIMAQIAKLGVAGYADKYDWDVDELVEELANVGYQDDMWRDEVIDHFNGIEGED